MADIDTGAPVTGNGQFRMGSSTKTFVAVTLLQLVGEKRLSLQDPVERWLHSRRRCRWSGEHPD